MIINESTHNETKDAIRQQRAREEYLAHSQRERLARANDVDPTVVILQALEELLRESAAAKTGGGK